MIKLSYQADISDVITKVNQIIDMINAQEAEAEDALREALNNQLSGQKFDIYGDGK